MALTLSCEETRAQRVGHYGLLWMNICMYLRKYEHESMVWELLIGHHTKELTIGICIVV